MNYDQALQCSMLAPGVVLLTSPTCAPCKVLKPILARLSVDLKFALSIIEVGGTLAGRLKVRAVPMILILVQGEEVARYTGLKTEAELRAIFEHHGVTQGQLDV